MISTDPPYYDNIAYADLSDVFYVWLRRTLGHLFPQLLATVLTPKSQELIASPFRHDGSREGAKTFLKRVLVKYSFNMREIQAPTLPLTISTRSSRLKLRRGR